ncbi:hypothetical protein [Thiomonas sp. X19]|uniref:hypothetical protein n=1 Tax=Thiomonas sp. X19 TaxID=1050370 RepID=UPI0011BDDB1E|nr:hypothetical protein [Thiomonas sp. X19]
MMLPDGLNCFVGGLAPGVCLSPAQATVVKPSPPDLIGLPPSIALASAPSQVPATTPAQRSNWGLYPASPTFGVGLADTYLIGAALGVLDYAGLYRLDHPVQQNTSGIWSIAKSPQFPAELIGLTLAGAVWEGGNNRLGKTLWQSVDAAAMAGISTQALKWTFQRTRPSATNNPGRRFQGVHNQSFPSGGVSSITALVTPIILEYHSPNQPGGGCAGGHSRVRHGGSHQGARPLDDRHRGRRRRRQWLFCPSVELTRHPRLAHGWFLHGYAREFPASAKAACLKSEQQEIMSLGQDPSRQGATRCRSQTDKQ